MVKIHDPLIHASLSHFPSCRFRMGSSFEIVLVSQQETLRADGSFVSPDT